MKYFKVNNPQDKTLFDTKGFQLVDRTLWTAKELERVNVNLNNFYTVFNYSRGAHERVKLTSLLEEIEIPKTKVYFFFGYRFASKTI